MYSEINVVSEHIHDAVQESRSNFKSYDLRNTFRKAAMMISLINLGKVN